MCAPGTPSTASSRTTGGVTLPGHQFARGARTLPIAPPPVPLAPTPAEAAKTAQAQRTQQAEADEILRATVRALVEDPAIMWAGVAFVEDGEPVLGPQSSIALGLGALNVDRATHGINYAAELDQQAVAHGLDQAAVMLGDPRRKDFVQVGLKPSTRSFLVGLAEAAITGDIGDKHRGEPALHVWLR